MSPHKKSKHINANGKQPTQATIRIQTLAVLCCVFSPSTAPSMLRRDVSHRVDVGSEVEALQVLTPRFRGFGLPISLISLWWICIHHQKWLNWMSTMVSDETADLTWFEYLKWLFFFGYLNEVTGNLRYVELGAHPSAIPYLEPCFLGCLMLGEWDDLCSIG